VQIRRKGHQPITETRPWSKAEAQRWAMKIESALAKGQSAGAMLARGVTIAQLIDNIANSATGLGRSQMRPTNSQTDSNPCGGPSFVLRLVRRNDTS